jgi:sirohydrochlorin cobaltochelatase
MRAIVVIGHGSLKSASGAAMIRIAARLREQGVAPIAEASFLNFNRPTLAEAVDRSIAQGARSIVVQPYFLVAGKYVCEDLPQQLAEQAQRNPQIAFEVAAAFGDHPALARLAIERARTADPHPAEGGPAALLLLAHGSPIATANAPLGRLAGRILAAGGYARVAVSYLECNAPSIPEAIDALATEGMCRIVAVPYFLQLGRHVAEDLPALIAQAQQRHPQIALMLAPHLGYDRALLEVVIDRVTEALALPAR